MNPISDLVENARLETQFHDGYTLHVYHEAGSNSSQRRVRREERWVPQKPLGRGAYGSVWLEKCSFERGVKVRAVKMIGKYKRQRNWEAVDFSRELEIVAKFSHIKYSLGVVSGLP
jgi:calcium/calmodulin-dependent protein kinase I